MIGFLCGGYNGQTFVSAFIWACVICLYSLFYVYKCVAHFFAAWPNKWQFAKTIVLSSFKTVWPSVRHLYIFLPKYCEPIDLDL